MKKKTGASAPVLTPPVPLLWRGATAPPSVTGGVVREYGIITNALTTSRCSTPYPFASEGELPSDIKFITKTGDGLATDITTDVFETLFNLGLFDKVRRHNATNGPQNNARNTSKAAILALSAF